MAYQIITDSSCDLSPELVKEKQLHVVPFYISFDEENYFKENEEIKVHEFYQKMVDNPDVFPKTFRYFRQTDGMNPENHLDDFSGRAETKEKRE